MAPRETALFGPSATPSFQIGAVSLAPAEEFLFEECAVSKSKGCLSHEEQT